MKPGIPGFFMPGKEDIMAITKQQMEEDQANFGLAFDEPEEAPVEQTEDEAFGLTPEDNSAEEPGDTATGEGPSVTIAVAAPAGGEEAPTEEAPAEEASAEPAFDVEKERQRLKSWEGILKKREEEMNSRAAPVEEEAGETEEAPAGTSVEDAIAALSQDFGEEFVEMIRTIARSEAMNAAGETVGEVGQTVEAIIADMNDSKQRAHFEKIFDAHPDFMEVGETPEFAQWVAEEGKEDVVDSGSAQEVIQMLDDYKATLGGMAAEEEAPVDTSAAEGVRSTGLRLPEAPQEASDFKDAWDQF